MTPDAAVESPRKSARVKKSPRKLADESAASPDKPVTPRKAPSKSTRAGGKEVPDETGDGRLAGAATPHGDGESKEKAKKAAKKVRITSASRPLPRT